MLRCTQHTKPNISYIYGWTSDDDKFVPGYGDKISPCPEIWTLPTFGSNRESKTWIKSRYHFTDRGLEKFIDNFLFQSLVYIYIIFIPFHFVSFGSIYSTINARIY